ncbi:pyruvate kinase [Galdieria sulphuraria]|uniref:Pyruvate kinase n=1 Tax=Galdieria sulphuraria TaxID=130081 RepID=M2WVY6_GALSU|nr:pyruvate kinase [Galdieria sulphuraria]EME28160.1 pyruvate kinase [Galdieria sulphuraria]|eukprot:XP_005704680.1 pyruvate kinase [Galdieria sulphuraria]
MWSPRMEKHSSSICFVPFVLYSSYHKKASRFSVNSLTSSKSTFYGAYSGCRSFNRSISSSSTDTDRYRQSTIGIFATQLVNGVLEEELNQLSKLAEYKELLANTKHPSKVVCTIGPKTCSFEMIKKLAEHGMNVLRMNMSHGTHEWHQQVINHVKQLNKESGWNIGILLDTKGPEVRSGDLKEPVYVEKGTRFTFTIRRQVDYEPFTTDVNYDDFVSDIRPGDVLLVDGGICSFLVKQVTDVDVITECLESGILTSRRHLNVRGKTASLPAITEKDWLDIDFGIRNDVDFIALSFVKHEDDVQHLKKYLLEHGSSALVISKIESAAAVQRLEPILKASDGAMVARGDLGAEIPVEDVPLVQEEIVRINRRLQKPTIVATHMLESMISFPSPTRAEVTDVSEAVRQGADATMLSGETANGSFPLEAVNTMCTIARSVWTLPYEYERYPSLFSSQDSSSLVDSSIAALCSSAAFLANHLSARALVVFTKTGKIACSVSAARPNCPVLAFTPDEGLKRRLSLYWGVEAYQIAFSNHPEETVSAALKKMTQRNMAKCGDLIVILSDMLVSNGTFVNSVQVRRWMEGTS